MVCAAHGEPGSTYAVGKGHRGVLAAQSQQFVHREGGGAEDGLKVMVSMFSACSWRNVDSEMRKEGREPP